MKLSASQKESLGTAADRYAGSVDQIAGYLQGRGFTQQAAATFRLGYVADPLIGDEDYQGRLSIPYVTPTGVVDIRYRSVDDRTPKYMSRPGATTRLFNVTDLAVASDTVAICEGEMDTMVASALCGIPAVGVPGANNWKPHFGLLFNDFRRVFVLCDGDQAGREFGKTVAREVEGAVVVHMPDGMDVNDLYLDGGANAVRAKVGM